MVHSPPPTKFKEKGFQDVYDELMERIYEKPQFTGSGSSCNMPCFCIVFKTIILLLVAGTLVNFCVSFNEFEPIPQLTTVSFRADIYNSSILDGSIIWKEPTNCTCQDTCSFDSLTRKPICQVSEDCQVSRPSFWKVNAFEADCEVEKQYNLVNSLCTDSATITTLQECQFAVETLGVDSSQIRNDSSFPFGCSLVEDQEHVVFNDVSVANHTVSQSEHVMNICKQSELETNNIRQSYNEYMIVSNDLTSIKPTNAYYDHLGVELTKDLPLYCGTYLSDEFDDAEFDEHNQCTFTTDSECPTGENAYDLSFYWSKQSKAVFWGVCLIWGFCYLATFLLIAYHDIRLLHDSHMPVDDLKFILHFQTLIGIVLSMMFAMLNYVSPTIQFGVLGYRFENCNCHCAYRIPFEAFWSGTMFATLVVINLIGLQLMARNDLVTGPTFWTAPQRVPRELLIAASPDDPFDITLHWQKAVNYYASYSIKPWKWKGYFLEGKLNPNKHTEFERLVSNQGVEFDERGFRTDVPGDAKKMLANAYLGVYTKSLYLVQGYIAHCIYGTGYFTFMDDHIWLIHLAVVIISFITCGLILSGYEQRDHYRRINYDKTEEHLPSIMQGVREIISFQYVEEYLWLDYWHSVGYPIQRMNKNRDDYKGIQRIQPYVETFANALPFLSFLFTFIWQLRDLCDNVFEWGFTNWLFAGIFLVVIMFVALPYCVTKIQDFTKEDEKDVPEDEKAGGSDCELSVGGSNRGPTAC